MLAVLLGFLLASLAWSADHRTPAGLKPANTDPRAAVLPGGRLLTPAGAHYFTGPGTFGLAISPDGQWIASADGGPNRYSITVLHDGKTQRIIAPRKGDPDDDEDEWRSVFMGLAFADGNKTLYASEGNSGRVRVLDATNGKKVRTFNLNTGGFKDSYTGDLALDRERGLLYVVDQANFRLVTIDIRANHIVGSVKTGRLPFAVALSEDGTRQYVTNLGLFEYKALDTPIPFPKFGFPSTQSREELGDPNVAEANSVAVIESGKLISLIRTGSPVFRDVAGGSSPSGILAVGNEIYVSNSHNDTISVLNAKTMRLDYEIKLRMPGLEKFRGVMPMGLAYYDEKLYVAEAGINAIGVISTKDKVLTGHIPSAWFPTRVSVTPGYLYVACAKGFGTGPNAGLRNSFQAELRRGVIEQIPLNTPLGTGQVLRNNGITPLYDDPPPMPPALKNVVIIVKENRTYDEVFGPPDLARFGPKVTPNHHEIKRRWASGDNFYADSEVSVDGHHWLVGAYPDTWTESSLMASYGGQKDFRNPTAAPGRLLFAQSNSSVHPEEQPELGSIWHHLERNKISFRNWGEGFELAGVDEGEGLKPTGARYSTNIPMPDPLFRNTSRTYPQFNTNIPDQYRVDQLLREWNGMKEFPRLMFIHLPQDHTAKVRPQDGYPTAASYVADNDYALGRILEYLSRRPEWKKTAVFVTEDDSQGGVDHIDSHRTVLLVASPYARRGHVMHTNTSFPGLLKTAFRILGIGPLNIYDAAAADLSDCFQPKPDFTPYQLQPATPEVFDPKKVKEPKDTQPGEAMDDPRVLRCQHANR